MLRVDLEATALNHLPMTGRWIYVGQLVQSSVNDSINDYGFFLYIICFR